MASALLLEPLPVDCEDGAEVHGVHVLGVAVHELADDDAAGAHTLDAAVHSPMPLSSISITSRVFYSTKYQSRRKN
jgi:hypothetical protein